MRQRVRTHAYHGLAVAALATALIAASCSSSDADTGGDGESLTLTAVTAWPIDSIQSHGIVMLKEKIEEESGGDITLRINGGPETIAPDALAEAVKNGVTDVANIATSYYNSLLPEGEVLNYSNYTAAEEIEGNRLSYLNELHNEVLNTQILGRSFTGSYALFTNYDVKSIEDLRNQTFRGSPTYRDFASAIGAETVDIPSGDTYDAIDRGIVSGFFQPYVGFTDWGLQEVTACKVTPYFWNLNDIFLINLDKWDSLSDEHRTIIQSAADEVAVEVAQPIEEEIAEEEQKLEEAGGRICELSDGDAFVDTTDSVGWDSFAQTIDPDHADNLEAELRK